jgi:hypothetical protein
MLAKTGQCCDDHRGIQQQRFARRQASLQRQAQAGEKQNQHREQPAGKPCDCG